MCLDVAERLQAQGIGVIVVDPRWVKPVPPALGRPRPPGTAWWSSSRTASAWAASARRSARRWRDAGIDVPVRTIGIPDRFLDHGKRAEVLVECGLTAQDISRSIVETMASRTAATESSAAADAELPDPAPSRPRTSSQ